MDDMRARTVPAGKGTAATEHGAFAVSAQATRSTSRLWREVSGAQNDCSGSGAVSMWSRGTGHSRRCWRASLERARRVERDSPCIGIPLDVHSGTLI